MKKTFALSKKVISLLLTVVTLLSVCSVFSFAEEDTFVPNIKNRSYYTNFFSQHQRDNDKDIQEMFSAYDSDYRTQELIKVVSQLDLNNCSETEKVKRICKWIYCNAQYGTVPFNWWSSSFDLENTYEYKNDLWDLSNGWSSMDQTIEGVLVNGYAVCAGLSDAFYRLAAFAKLEVVEATGMKGSLGHAWNFVKVDGKWYLVDLATPNTNEMTRSVNSRSSYKYKGLCKHYNPKTNIEEFFDAVYNEKTGNFDYPDPEKQEWWSYTGEGLYLARTGKKGHSYTYDESIPEVGIPTITAEPACGASVKIQFSKVPNAICYRVFRNYYTEGRNYEPENNGSKISIIGSAIATISPEKAEELNYTYYDNSYMYDTYKDFEPLDAEHTDTGFMLREGNKKYVYTVAAYGDKRGFDLGGYSNSEIVTTNSDRGNLKFFKWDGKLEPHTFNKPVVTQAATCTHTGKKAIICKDCGYTYIADTPRSTTSHTYKVTTTPATCTKAGVKKEVCSACGDVKTTSIPATGHSWTQFETTEQPTCYTQGSKHRYCTVCQKEETEIIPQLTHNLVYSHTLYTASCEDSGLEVYECSLCHDMIEKNISAYGHKFVAKVTPATANSVGYTTYTCDRCKSSYTEKYTAPTGKISGIKCVARTAQAEKFTWNKVEGANGYQVQITNAKGNAWSTLKSLNANTNTYVFTGLEDGGAYKVHVRYWIKDPTGVNRFSAWSTAIVSPTLPKTNGIKKVTPAKRSAVVVWNKRAGVSGYQIQYATNPAFKGARLKAFTNKYGSHNFAGLRTNSRCYFRVRTFKTIAGVHYYSTWSVAKCVRIK